MTDGPALTIIVVGGSIAGLATVHLLLGRGFEVEVFERSAGDRKDRGGGIVVAHESALALEQTTDGGSANLGVRGRHRVVLLADDTEPVELEPQDFTSWDAIHGRLLRAFQAERYHRGHELVGLARFGVDATAACGNGVRREGRLVIGADGARGAVRRFVDPEAETVYAGYVAWRGVIEEAGHPALAGPLGRGFTLSAGRAGHMVAYPIPGGDGSTRPSRRRINWVWYQAREDAAPGWPGRGREGGVRGLVRAADVPETEARALREWACALPTLFRSLVHATDRPFVQPILDLAVSRMARGPVAVLGDAAFVVRPHTASGTSKACGDALALAENLHPNMDDPSSHLADWTEARRRVGEEIFERGVGLGRRLVLGG